MSDIHEVVRNRYGAIARASASQQAVPRRGQSETAESSASCCSDGGSCNTRLYDPGMLEGLPVDVTGIALGCGDPVSIASLNPGEKVLDLGSGGGIDCFLAAKRVGEQGHVIGVDMTPEMLGKARRNAVAAGLGNVEFREGYGEALPVPDGWADVVISNGVLNLFPDKSAGLREMGRMLKPGGRLQIGDIIVQKAVPESAKRKIDLWTG